MNRIHLGPLDLYGCREARERLEPYIDGELPRAEHRRVRFHLTICRQCAPLFRFEENLDAHIRQSLATVDASPELDARLRTAIQHARENH